MNYHHSRFRSSAIIFSLGIFRMVYACKPDGRFDILAALKDVQLSRAPRFFFLFNFFSERLCAPIRKSISKNNLMFRKPPQFDVYSFSLLYLPPSSGTPLSQNIPHQMRLQPLTRHLLNSPRNSRVPLHQQHHVLLFQFVS